MLNALPWYKRTFRWGQTNLNELDPATYAVDWWRDYWLRTHTQGVIVNAGGIVAFYPSHFGLHYRAAYLGDRDLFGEIVSTAHDLGLVVLARMDSSRASPQFYQEHPDWFTINAQDMPGTAGGRYIACINSPYTRQYMPQILTEIIQRYHPDGFTDNSWTGMGRNWICQCEYCQAKFRQETGANLPLMVDWDDPLYRQWVRWSYQCRNEIWELNNQVTQSTGGPDCLWVGMINGDPLNSHLSFCDLKTIAGRSNILLSDQQSRGYSGFEQNSQSGSLLHSLTGWETIIPESMALYVRGAQAFRKASAPPLEAQKWMVSGFAGGISPWWHHVGAVQEDRRQFDIVEKLMDWHAVNQEYLYHRQSAANVGLVWSHGNIDFYGRDQAASLITEPWHGISRALVRARIPYIPLHVDHIERDDPKMNVLILPELGALSDRQIHSMVGFVESGGSLVVSGRTGMFDEDGQLRSRFPLGELLGIRHTGEGIGSQGSGSSAWEVYHQHNYLRLPMDLNLRHPILAGFEKTNLLPFGGTLQKIIPEQESRVIAYYVPAFPIYPPETSYIRETSSNWPAMICRQHPAGGRLVYLAADIDRVYGLRGLPDHGDLLENAIRWAANETIPISVEGPGYLDCHLYRQATRLILQIVNLSGCNINPGYLEEHLPIGPLRISIRTPNSWKPEFVSLRVSSQRVPISIKDGWAQFEMQKLVDHELAVIPSELE